MQQAPEFANTSSTPPKIRRPRLKPMGVTVLEDFAKNNPGYLSPTVSQQQALLDKIHAIPGCEDYTLHNLKAWFQRRRRPAAISTDTGTYQSKSKEPLSGLSATASYPSLTGKSIQTLRVLCQGNLTPSHEVIATWAELLGANEDDIIAWLSEQYHYETTSDDPRSPFHRLPTPASTSPEPSENQYEAQSLKGDPLYSPIVPALLPLINLKTDEQKAHKTLSTEHLLSAIADATSAPKPSTALPNTAHEFEELFNPYMKKIEVIIAQNLELLSHQQPHP